MSDAASAPLLRSLDEEVRLLALLVERGALSAVDVDKAKPDGDTPGQRLEALLRDGKIARGVVDAALSDLRFSAAATIDPLDNTQRSDRHALPSGALRRQYGSYEIEHLLGRGGCGEVYRAHDSKLGRTVALKLLNTVDAEQHERLKREAQLQARIAHENVCQVYEVGEAGDRGFIAMQFIDGADLGTVAARLSVREIATLMERVAAAIDAAHAEGLVHRDLKPANILVERTRDGEWKPYVVDFGLARESSAPGLTATGLVVGTAHYMSPEQARGDRNFDHRVDIYALGATLYELLCGSPPFDGDTPLSVLQQVIADQPATLRSRNGRIPVDLETIVHRCLEKEAARRYPSAGALAADLRRFLDGEPIIARPPTLAYRLRLQLRRRRRELIVASIGLGALVFVGGLQLRQLVLTRTEASYVRAYDATLAELLRDSERLRFAPPHNIEAELRALHQRTENLAAEIETRGALGRAHGLYVLGRCWATLGEFERARPPLERAWKDGAKSSRVAAALGQVLTGLYLARRSPADSSMPPSAREEERKILDELYRTPALDYLAKAEGDAANEDVLLARARIALLSGQTDNAIALATTAKGGRAWLSEAEAIIAEAYRLMCIRQLDASQLVEAKEPCSQASTAAEGAITIARSDYGLRILLAKMRASELDLAARQSQPTGPAYEQLHVAFRAAAELRPIDPDRDALELMAVVPRALHDIDHGDDPRSYLAPAVRALDHNEPTGLNGWRARLAGRYALAEAAIAFGGDAKVDIDEGVRAAHMIQKRDPGPWSDERLLLVLRVRFESLLGKPDAEAAYQELVALSEKILKARPDDVDTAHTIGVAHLEWAQWMATQRRDNLAVLQAAEVAFEKSLGGVREAALYNLGAIALLRADRALGIGEDPIHDLDAAETQIRSALDLLPNDAGFSAGLVATLITRVHFFLVKNDLAAAERAIDRGAPLCERGLANDAHNPELLHRCSRLALLLGSVRLAQKASPQVALDRALSLGKRFRATLPESRDSANLLARVTLARAGQERSDSVATTLNEEAARLLETSAASAAPTGETELLRLQLAWSEARRRHDKAATEAARAALERAVKPADGRREFEDERLLDWVATK